MKKFFIAIILLSSCAAPMKTTSTPPITAPSKYKYFRLMQVDKDGNKSYSKIINIQ